LRRARFFHVLAHTLGRASATPLGLSLVALKAVFRDDGDGDGVDHDDDDEEDDDDDDGDGHGDGDDDDDDDDDEYD
jgi:hypothetical protein